MSDICDVPGIRVGHWTDTNAATGCTVVLVPEGGAVASVDVRGAAPGTRETDLLRPDATVQRVHAVMLSGGSAFGLAAADGVMGWLAERGVGFPTSGGPVPIVPAAVLYDLAVGDGSIRADGAAGRAACESATDRCGEGRIGAGAGATVGKLTGRQPLPAGLGTGSRSLPDGHVVGVVVAVNAAGDVVGEDGTVLAGYGVVDALLGRQAQAEPDGGSPLGTNTTLAVVATDLPLDKPAAHRLATVAHDALAQSIRPVHTRFDGDTVFALSNGTGAPVQDPIALTQLEVAAVEVLAEAIRSTAGSS